MLEKMWRFYALNGSQTRITEWNRFLTHRSSTGTARVLKWAGTDFHLGRDNNSRHRGMAINLVGDSYKPGGSPTTRGAQVTHAIGSETRAQNIPWGRLSLQSGR